MLLVGTRLHFYPKPFVLQDFPGPVRTLGLPTIWNTLPTDVVAASSLSTFRRMLKRFLIKQSYPDIIQLVVLAVVAPLSPL